MKTLRERLADWQDIDSALCALAIVLGVIPDTETTYQDNKALFWTASPAGDALGFMLREMVKGGILDFRDLPDQDYQYRWHDETQKAL